MATLKRRRRHGQGETPHVKRYPLAYWVAWAIALLPFAYTAIIVPEEFRIWILGVTLAIVAVLTKIPGSEYRPFVKVLGLFSINTWGGPVPIIPGVMEMIKVPRYLKLEQYPAAPELVYKGDDKDDLPVLPDGRKMVRPLRLWTGRPRPDYEHSPLNVQMMTTVTGTTRLEVRDAIDLWTRHAGETVEEKIAEAQTQINDQWLQSVQLEWGKRPAGLIIDEERRILEAVQRDLDNVAYPRGLNVHNLTVVHPDLTHAVAKALSGIAEARANKITTMRNAEAAQYETVLGGKADAQVKLDKEKAETDASAYRAEKLHMDPVEIVALETAVDLMGDRSQFFFGTGAVGEALGSAFSIVDRVRRGYGLSLGPARRRRKRDGVAKSA